MARCMASGVASGYDQSRANRTSRRRQPMSLLEETINSIGPVDQAASERAARRLDSLTKPIGSLGLLEEIARRYAAIRHDDSGAIGRIAITIFAADHGVVDEGVSAYPSAVTAQMVRNLANGGAAIAVLAR